MDEDIELKLKKMLSNIQTGEFHDKFSSSKPINHLDKSFEEIEKLNKELLILLNKKK